MPVRKGHMAPRTTLIEIIIRKFDTHGEFYDDFIIVLAFKSVKVHSTYSTYSPPYPVRLNLIRSVYVCVYCEHVGTVYLVKRS